MQRPSALGLFLCEQVVLHAETGRRTLFAMFDSLTCDEVPFVAPPFTAYAALTDGQGRMNLELVVTDIDEEVELLSAILQINLPHPLFVAHVRIRLRGLTFSEPGHYLFELSVNGESLCHRRLHLRASEDQP